MKFCVVFVTFYIVPDGVKSPRERTHGGREGPGAEVRGGRVRGAALVTSIASLLVTSSKKTTCTPN